MSSKVLLTGATGFVGKQLLDKLITNGANVRCFVRNGTTLSVMNERVEIFHGNILNVKDCYEALKDIDIVYHVAGLGLSKIKENITFNETSTRLLLEAANEHDREISFIYVSSIKAVGPSQSGLITERKEYAPTDLYGISKAKAEEEILKFENTKIKGAIIRPPAVYGPGDRNLFPLFKLIHQGIQIKIVGKDLNKFSMVYVSDLAECLIHISNNLTTGIDILNISNHDIVDWNTFFEYTPIITKTKKVKKIFIPQKGTYYALKLFANILSAMNKTEILPLSRVNDLLNYNWSLDTSKAVAEYGLLCNTPISKGIVDTYNWYLENGWFEQKG